MTSSPALPFPHFKLSERPTQRLDLTLHPVRSLFQSLSPFPSGQLRWLVLQRSNPPSNVTWPRSLDMRPPYAALYPSGNIASLAKHTPSPLAKARLSYTSAQGIESRPSTLAPAQVGMALPYISARGG